VDTTAAAASVAVNTTTIAAALKYQLSTTH
jgi:hypothetical protein